MVVGTAVHVLLSGEVSSWTVAAKEPVTDRVTPQFTHGVAPAPPLRFEIEPLVGTPVPVKVAVRVQSGVVWACVTFRESGGELGNHK